MQPHCLISATRLSDHTYWEGNLIRVPTHPDTYILTYLYMYAYRYDIFDLQHTGNLLYCDCQDSVCAITLSDQCNHIV